MAWPSLVRLTLIGLCSAGISVAQPKRPPVPPSHCVQSPGHSLDVVLVNYTPGKDVFLAMFASAEDFQKSRQCRVARFFSDSATGDTLRFAFDSLPEGDYAIASYQDMDGDGKMSRGLFGMPTDPYRIYLPNYNIFGPKFDKCKFHVPGVSARIVIDYARKADKARTK